MHTYTNKKTVLLLMLRWTDRMVEWLAFFLRILENPSSNIVLETGYPDWGFRDFPYTLQEDAGIVP